MTALSYYGLISLPTRYIFSVTSWLIALLAAGMAAQAVRFLQSAGVKVWDTSWLLSDSSIVGRMLHVLIGYTDRPTAFQLVAYIVTLATIIMLTRAARRPNQATASAQN